MPKPVRVLLGSVAMLAASAAVGLGFNAVRGEASVPLVPSAGYYDSKVFVPCPEVLEQPEALSAGRVLRWNPESLLVVDARAGEEYEQAHHPGAVSFPYSVLFPPEPADVSALAGRAGERTIVVCGDPEIGSGRLLAADLMTAGLDQVYYVEGGCTALMEGEACRGPR